ncbi:MAG TPA: nuclease-like protein [Alphaproteobacteria bacterium]|nr:nuclease-like protein [Alphaproteobacteria bacterium]
MIRAAALWLLMVLGLDPAAADEFTSYAIVREDASLLIAGRVVRLYGIYIPETGTTCRTFISPAQCASRAALALEFKTDNLFVTCRELVALSDGSVSAYCWVEEDEYEVEDLAAYLIRQGWALAAPGAPFEYAALERIAERRGMGVWGFQVDQLRVRRHRD